MTLRIVRKSKPLFKNDTERKAHGRRLYVAARRKEGMTFKKIGELIGVSKARAAGIYNQYLYRNRNGTIESFRVTTDVYEDFVKHYESAIS